MTDISTDAAPKGMGDNSFDPDRLLKKYRSERDKRIRPDGIKQYREITGQFAHFITDPYVEPGFTREPLFDGWRALARRRGYEGPKNFLRSFSGTLWRVLISCHSGSRFSRNL